ncbi:hypothetical protein [Alloscardovia macacae]|nr:hypothetical protein [Alloscardovia macacae]
MLHAISIIQIRAASILMLLLCILNIGEWSLYATAAAAITYVMENIKPVAFIMYRIILEDDEYNKRVIKRNIVILHAFTCVVILTLAVTDWIHDVAKFSFFNPFWLSDDSKQTAFYSIMQKLSDRVVVFAVIFLLACFIYSKIQNHIESAIRGNFHIVTETD